MMAILGAKVLITLGASRKRWCQCQETWVPLTDAITLQPAVVPVDAMGVIETLTHPCRFGIGVCPVSIRVMGALHR